MIKAITTKLTYCFLLFISFSSFADNETNKSITFSNVGLNEEQCKNQLLKGLFDQQAIYSSHKSSVRNKKLAEKKITLSRKVFDQTSSFCETFSSLKSFKP